MDREGLERHQQTLSLCLFAFPTAFQAGRLAHFLTRCLTRGCTNPFEGMGKFWLLFFVPLIFVVLTPLLFYLTSDAKRERRPPVVVNRRAVTLAALVGGVFGFALPTILGAFSQP